MYFPLNDLFWKSFFALQLSGGRGENMVNFENIKGMGRGGVSLLAL